MQIILDIPDKLKSNFTRRSYTASCKHQIAEQIHNIRTSVQNNAMQAEKMKLSNGGDLEILSILEKSLDNAKIVITMDDVEKYKAPQKEPEKEPVTKLYYSCVFNEGRVLSIRGEGFASWKHKNAPNEAKKYSTIEEFSDRSKGRDTSKYKYGVLCREFDYRGNILAEYEVNELGLRLDKQLIVPKNAQESSKELPELETDEKEKDVS